MNYLKYFGTRAQQLEYLTGKGWHVVTFKNCSAVVAWQELAGKVFAKAWRGNADKPAWYYSFKSVATATEYANRFAGNVRLVESYKSGQKKEAADKRAALKAADHWAIGDVLYNSWGYDQTNIDWYQVVEVKAKTIVIRAIHKNYAEQSFMSGPSQPKRNDFCGEPMLKPLSMNGQVRFRHGGGSKWDGSAVWESHYA